MKTIYKILFCFIALSFFACDNDDDNTVERNQLKLSPSAEKIVLDQSKPDDEALTFTWTEATGIGQGYTFTYIFSLDMGGHDFETAIEPIVAEDGAYSVSFTTEQLYSYIVEKWGGVAGQESTIEGRIVAKVNGPEFQYPEIAIQSVVVQTYVPQSVPLYMYGSATDAGANPNNAIQLDEISNGRVYSWKGNLQPGEYKFIYHPGEVLPSLNRGEADTLVVKRESAGEPDNYFKINVAGTYSIYLSVKEMKIWTKRSLYEYLYLVGDATDAGWDTGTAIQMVAEAANPALFTVTTALKAGEMKILTARLWESATFRPMVADGSITSTATQVYQGDPDLKWRVTADQAGSYKITLDVENLTIHFDKQ